jgi:hypothetical protein
MTFGNGEKFNVVEPAPDNYYLLFVILILDVTGDTSTLLREVVVYL